MIEKTILDFLNENLGVPVVMEKPEGEVDEFVLIEKTGSSESDYIKSATFAIQSYSTSLYKACVLNEEVKGAMMNINTLHEISRAKLNTDYNFTDTTTKRYRYQAIYDITY